MYAKTSRSVIHRVQQQQQQNASPRSSISQLDILPIKHLVAQIKRLNLQSTWHKNSAERSLIFYLIIIEFAALQMEFIIMRDYYFRLRWRGR